MYVCFVLCCFVQAVTGIVDELLAIFDEREKSDDEPSVRDHAAGVKVFLFAFGGVFNCHFNC